MVYSISGWCRDGGTYGLLSKPSDFNDVAHIRCPSAVVLDSAVHFRSQAETGIMSILSILSLVLFGLHLNTMPPREVKFSSGSEMIGFSAFLLS